MQPSPVGTAKVIAIGCSTGGPAALSELWSCLPGDLAVPILIAQHMPGAFTSKLASQLDAQVGIPAVEAKRWARIEPGVAYVAPGGSHMVVRREDGVRQIGLTADPPRNSVRPSVDTLFESVAKCYGRTALAVVLTGMGQDGLAGARAIAAVGGTIVVQDAASSAVWGMAGAVAQAGLAQAALTIPELAGFIARRCARRLSTTRQVASG